MLGAMESSTSDSPRSPAPVPHVSIKQTFRAQDVRCSFCGRPSISSQRIVGGPGEGPNQVFICENCVALCAEILAETDP